MKHKMLDELKKMPLNLIAEGAEKASKYSAEGFCFWLMYQEEMPEELKQKILKNKK